MPMFTVTIRMKSGEDKRGRGLTMREALMTVGTRHPIKQIERVIIHWRGNAAGAAGIRAEADSLLEALMLYADATEEWRNNHATH